MSVELAGQDKVLQDVPDLQAASDNALQSLRQMRLPVRPPLHITGHLHREEQLQSILLLPVCRLMPGVDDDRLHCERLLVLR